MKKILNNSMNMELLLRAIYGQRYYGTAGYVFTFAEWKKTLLKLSHALERATQINLDTADNYHKDKINNRLHCLAKEIKEAKNVNDMNRECIIELVRLNLLLLGDIPNNWKLKKVTQDGHFKLSLHRKMTFTQSTGQKVQLIFDLAEGGFEGLKYQKLVDEYLRLEGNRDLFLKWFRETHTSTYLKIF